MDITERLRAWERGACMRPNLYDEAADEIDRLRAENERLRGAIHEALRLLGMDRPVNPADVLRAALRGGEE